MVVAPTIAPVQSSMLTLSSANTLNGLSTTSDSFQTLLKAALTKPITEKSQSLVQNTTHHDNGSPRPQVSLPIVSQNFSQKNSNKVFFGNTQKNLTSTKRKARKGGKPLR